VIKFRHFIMPTALAQQRPVLSHSLRAYEIIDKDWEVEWLDNVKPETSHPPHTSRQPGPGLGVASMVLGIVGIVFCWVPVLNWILGLLAIILGAVGVRRVAGKGMAVAGLVLGIITIALNILAATLVASLFHALM
jgi:hypothetical protein